MLKYPSLIDPILSGADAESVPYFAKVGRFIVAYAAAESMMHMLARHLSGLDDRKARIIFGGMPLRDLTERVRQMMTSTEQSPASLPMSKPV
jgi:hypothetical protein